MSTHTQSHPCINTYMHKHKRTRMHSNTYAQTHTWTDTYTDTYTDTLLNYVSPTPQLSPVFYLYSSLLVFRLAVSLPPLPDLSLSLVRLLPAQTWWCPGPCHRHSPRLHDTSLGAAARQSARPSTGQSVCLYPASLFLSLYPCALLPLRLSDCLFA